MYPDDILKQFESEYKDIKHNKFVKFKLSSLNRSLIGGIFMLFLAMGVVAVSLNLNSIKVLLSSKASGADVIVDKAVTEKILSTGKTKVLVKLNSPFVVESGLSGTQLTAQRNGIQSQKAQVISGLSGQSYKINQEYKTIPWIAMEVSPQALLKLQTMKGIVSQIVEDKELKLNSITSPNWNFYDIRVDKAWQTGFNGVGSTVAIIDSSFVPENTLFTGLVAHEVCLYDCANGANFQEGPGVSKKCDFPSDECSHGSNVAQIISTADSYDSVTRGAKLIFLSVYSQCHTENCHPISGSESSLILALEWIYENRTTYHIDAVNMSINISDSLSSTYCDESFPEFVQVFDNLYAANIPVIVSSGNDSDSYRIGAPSCMKKVIPAGGATGSLGGSIGIWPGGNRGNFFNLLFAPGINVPTLNPYDLHHNEHNYISGTSIAAPHLTGAMAILKKVYPTVTVDNMVNALKATALDLIDDGAFYSYIQVDKAIDYLRTTTGTTTFGSGSTGLVTSFINNGGTLPTQPTNYSNIAIVTASYRAHNNLDASVSSLTYCGLPMYRIGGSDALTKRKHQDQNIEMWYLMNPPSGSCEVKATFNKDPEDRMVSASVINGVQSSNFIESYNFAGYDYPPGSNYLLLSKNGPKDTKFVCSYSTYPNSSNNQVTTAGANWTQLWNSGYVSNAKNVQSGIGISNQRVVDNELSQIRWNSTQVYPWSALCFNLRMKPSSGATPPPSTPAPLPGVDLKINGTNGPVTMDGFTPITITWSSSYVTNCTASGGWSGTKAVNGSESKLVNRTNKFSIYCTGPNGAQVSDAVQLYIAYDKGVCWDKAVPSGVDYMWKDMCRGVFTSYSKNPATNKYYCALRLPPMPPAKLGAPTPSPYSYILSGIEAVQYYAWKDALKPKTPCYGLLFQ